MAGAVARYVKWLFSTRMGLVNLISIAGTPHLVYILLQQEKEFARIAQEKKLVDERFEALRASGVIRVRRQ